MNDMKIEQEIQERGLTAPRITPADIEANIVSEFYFTAADGVRGESQLGTSPGGRAESLERLTFCVLVLKNGFTVTGESACASPENFNAEIGRKIARQNAAEKVWPLMGYELRTVLCRKNPQYTGQSNCKHGTVGCTAPEHRALTTPTLSFGHALESMKAGNKVARSGWNGKGMWLEYVAAENWFMNANHERLYGDERLPWIGMKTADNKFVPWLASQTDMLAEDWMVVL